MTVVRLEEQECELCVQGDALDLDPLATQRRDVTGPDVRHVRLACPDHRRSGLQIRHDQNSEALEFGAALLVPVIDVRGVLHGLAELAGREFPRPATQRLLGQVRAAIRIALGQHREVPLNGRELILQGHVRLLQSESCGVLVDDLDTVHIGSEERAGSAL